MSNTKRPPGRPLTPGNQPGSDGNPALRIRMAPADLERVRQAGGSTWARGALLEALEAREGARGEEES